jgi:hypothetical protein
MKIRVLVRGVDRVFRVQERTIVMDEKKLSSMWTKREVRVDRPFDVDPQIFALTRFENCEFCILAPPSRRLSQHLLQAMHHERRDQLLRRWMPLMLIVLLFAIIACFVWGCSSSRCFISPLLYAWGGLGNAFDCVLHEKPCKVPIGLAQLMRRLPLSDNVMKIVLLAMCLVFFTASLLAYLVLFLVVWMWSLSWLQPFLFSRSFAREDEREHRRQSSRHSLEFVRDRCD